MRGAPQAADAHHPPFAPAVRGLDLDASAWPLGTPALEPRSFYLRTPSIDVMHLRPFPRVRLEILIVAAILGAVSVVLPAAYLLSGGGATGSAPGGREARENTIAAVGLGSAGLLVSALLLAEAVRARFSGDVVFDRAAGTIRGRCWRDGRWQRDVRLAFTDVVAVQICAREIRDGDDGLLYTALELNLIATTPPGRRLGLASHADDPALTSDAKALAAFLGCGVVDDRHRLL